MTVSVWKFKISSAPYFPFPLVPHFSCVYEFNLRHVLTRMLLSGHLHQHPKKSKIYLQLSLNYRGELRKKRWEHTAEYAYEHYIWTISKSCDQFT